MTTPTGEKAWLSMAVLNAQLGNYTALLADVERAVESRQLNAPVVTLLLSALRDANLPQSLFLQVQSSVTNVGVPSADLELDAEFTSAEILSPVLSFARRVTERCSSFVTLRNVGGAIFSFFLFIPINFFFVMVFVLAPMILAVSLGFDALNWAVERISPYISNDMKPEDLDGVQWQAFRVELIAINLAAAAISLFITYRAFRWIVRKQRTIISYLLFSFPVVCLSHFLFIFGVLLSKYSETAAFKAAPGDEVLQLFRLSALAVLDDTLRGMLGDFLETFQIRFGPTADSNRSIMTSLAMFLYRTYISSVVVALIYLQVAQLRKPS